MFRRDPASCGSRMEGLVCCDGGSLVLSRPDLSLY